MIFLTLVQGISTPSKGGSKVEVKNSPPPLKTSLYKGVFVNLVEVEVNSLQFFSEFDSLLSIQTLAKAIPALLEKKIFQEFLVRFKNCLYLCT